MWLVHDTQKHLCLISIIASLLPVSEGSPIVVGFLSILL